MADLLNVAEADPSEKQSHIERIMHVLPYLSPPCLRELADTFEESVWFLKLRGPQQDAV